MQKRSTSIVRPTSDPSDVLQIRRLVRPFTQTQLKDYLSETGQIVEFWIDPNKTHAIVQYATVAQAVATFKAVDGRIWPKASGRALEVNYTTRQDAKEVIELDEQLAAAPSFSYMDGPSRADDGASPRRRSRSPPPLRRSRSPPPRRSVSPASKRARESSPPPQAPLPGPAVIIPPSVEKQIDMRKVFVGNLAPWVTHDELKKIFSKVGGTIILALLLPAHVFYASMGRSKRPLPPTTTDTSSALAWSRSRTPTSPRT